MEFGTYVLQNYVFGPSGYVSNVYAGPLDPQDRGIVILDVESCQADLISFLHSATYFNNPRGCRYLTIQEFGPKIHDLYICI